MKIITDISEEDEGYLPLNVRVLRSKAISNTVALIELEVKDMPGVIKEFVVMKKTRAKVISMFNIKKNLA